MRLMWVYQTGVKIILSTHKRAVFTHTNQQCKTITQKFTNFRKPKDHLILDYVKKKQTINWILGRSDFPRNS